MHDPDLIALFAHPLTRLGIRYMISGSVAAMLFGEPRLTLDIDLVVFLGEHDAPRLAIAYPPPEFYLPPPEVIAIERARERRGHFNVIHTTSGLKADVYPSNDNPLHDWAIARARTFPLVGESVTVAPPEYVIIRKLEYFREGGSEKHRRDVRSMLGVSGDRLDRPGMEEWLERMGLDDLWRGLQSKPA